MRSHQNLPQYAIVAFALCIILLFAGCSGGGQPGTLADSGESIESTTDTALPYLPTDAYVDPEVILNRRGAEIYTRELPASEYFAKSPQAEADDEAGTLTFGTNTVYHGFWAVYRFADLLPTDNLLYLETSFDTSALPYELWIGISDYESNTWHWIQDEHPAGINALTIPTDLQAISPGGAIYIVVATQDEHPSGEETAVIPEDQLPVDPGDTGGSTEPTQASTVFRMESLALHLDTGQLPPPVGLTASHGIAANAIQLTWKDPALTYGVEYTGVQIDRALDLRGPWTKVGTEPAGAVSHWDTVNAVADSGQEVYYRLRTVNAGQVGWQSQSVVGWTAAGPIECLEVNEDIYDYIELTWDNSDPDVIGYDLYYRPQPEINPTEWVLLDSLGPDESQYSHTADSPPGLGCELNTVYQYYLKANYPSGEWKYSNHVSGFVTIAPVHFGLASKGTFPDQIMLAWGASTGVIPADGYLIDYRSRSGGMPVAWTRFAEIDDSDQRSLTHDATNPPGTEFEPFTEYEYRVTPTWEEYQGLIPSENYGYAGVGGGDWNMEGRDRRHTRRSPFVGPVDPVMKWKMYVDPVYKYNGVVGYDGSMYLGTHIYGDTLAPDGNHKWYTDMGTVWSTAIATDGTVYAAFYGQNIKAYSPAGDLLWVNYTAADGYDGALVLDDDGTIFAGGKAGTLYAINPDGSDKFLYSSSGEINWSPAIADDGTIYFTREIDETESYLTAVNPDGTWKWDYPLLAATPTNAPSIGDSGMVYLSTTAGLTAINPDGSLSWVFEPDVQFNTNPAIAADGTLYAGTDDGRLFAISPEGARNWAFEAFSVTGTRIYSSPAIDGAGNIYFASYYGSLYCLGPDAELLWRYDTGYRQIYSPVIADSGTVYFLCNLILGPGYQDPRTYLLAFGPAE